MPVVLIAELPILQGKGAQFEEAFAELTAQVRANEPACLQYQLTKGQKDATKYTVVEMYENMAAIDAHGKTTWFKAGSKKFGAFLAGKPKVLLFDTVGEVAAARL